MFSHSWCLRPLHLPVFLPCVLLGSRLSLALSFPFLQASCCGLLWRKSHSRVDGCQPKGVVFYPNWQSFHRKVGSSATLFSCFSKFSLTYLPHQAILSFLFSNKKFRPSSMNLLNNLPTFHKLICNHFYLLM